MKRGREEAKVSVPEVLLTTKTDNDNGALVAYKLLRTLIGQGIGITSFGYKPSCVSPVFRSEIVKAGSHGLSAFFASTRAAQCLLKGGTTSYSVTIVRNIVNCCSNINKVSAGTDTCSLTSAASAPIVLIMGDEKVDVSLTTCVGNFVRCGRGDRVGNMVFGRVSPVLCPEVGGLIRRRLRIRILKCIPGIRSYIVRDHRLNLILPRRVSSLGRHLRGLTKVLRSALRVSEVLTLTRGTRRLRIPRSLVRGSEACKCYLPRGLHVKITGSRTFYFFCRSGFHLLRRVKTRLISFSPIRSRRLPTSLSKVLLCNNCPRLGKRTLRHGTSVGRRVTRTIGRNVPYVTRYKNFVCLRRRVRSVNKIFQGAYKIVPKGYFHAPELAEFKCVALATKGPIFNEDTRRVNRVPTRRFRCFSSRGYKDSFRTTGPVDGEK